MTTTISAPLRTAVIIATKGRAQALWRLLQILERQTRAPSVVVISATESADVGPLPKSALNIECVFGTPGLCAQRNRGLDRVRGDCDLVVFFDDDFVPAPHWIERCARVFGSDETIVGLSGRVLLDGAQTHAVSWEEADRLVGSADASETALILTEASDLYGCNMAFRMRALGGDIRFDERLALYGWLEDKDFSRAAGRAGRLVQCDAVLGVHLGLKHGRVSGTRYGYSQIVNAWYLYRKGTLSRKEAWSNTLRALAMNGLKTLRPEPFIDRRGRFKGNVAAVRHLLAGICRPENAAEF